MPIGQVLGNTDAIPRELELDRTISAREAGIVGWRRAWRPAWRFPQPMSMRSSNLLHSCSMHARPPASSRPRQQIDDHDEPPYAELSHLLSIAYRSSMFEGKRSYTRRKLVFSFSSIIVTSAPYSRSSRSMLSLFSGMSEARVEVQHPTSDTSVKICLLTDKIVMGMKMMMI